LQFYKDNGIVRIGFSKNQKKIRFSYMQPNEKIICPACGEPSMAKLQVKMDGFRKTGEVLVCMLCNAELTEVNTAEQQSDAARNDQKLHDLGMLLGAVPVATARLTAADDEKRFCKDCKHFLKHPFVDRCDLDNHPVEAMDDCSNFAPRN